MGASFALSSPYTDAQLVALCAVARGRLRLYGEAIAALGDLDGDKSRPEQEAHLERSASRLLNEWHVLVGIIIDTPAHHQMGKTAKARTLASLRDQRGYRPGDCIFVDLAYSLIGDHHLAEVSSAF